MSAFETNERLLPAQFIAVFYNGSISFDADQSGKPCAYPGAWNPHRDDVSTSFPLTINPITSASFTGLGLSAKELTADARTSNSSRLRTSWGRKAISQRSSSVRDLLSLFEFSPAQLAMSA